MPGEVTIGNTGRHNKYVAKATVSTTEDKEEIKEEEIDKKKEWEDAPKVESAEQTFKARWEIITYNQEKKPFAKILFRGEKSLLALDPKEPNFDVGVLQGMTFRAAIPESAIYYRRKKIYIGKVVRNDLEIKKKGPKPKVKQLIFVVKEERKQIRMELSKIDPQKEDEFAIDSTSKAIKLFDNKMAKIIQTLLEKTTEVNWYIGLNQKDLVLPRGASKESLDQAKQAILTTDIFM